jgi:periplasmic divalent cation tolerance protein
MSKQPAVADLGLGEPITLVHTTADDREKLAAIARSLVAGRLAACVQISGPITSHYYWEGQAAESTEWLLTAKTWEERLPALLAAIRAEHPYQLPEIVWQPVSAAANYAAWVREQVSRV